MTRRQGIKPNAWTDAENALMREHYRATGATVLLTLLARSRKAITEQAARLGLSAAANLWTPEQDEAIRQHYAERGSPVVAAMVGRTEQAVRYRAARLGIRGSQRRPKPRPSRPKNAPAPTLLRRSTAKPKAPPQPAGPPIITSQTRVTIAPAFVDRRFAPNGPPPRVVDPDACRDWAMAAARVDGVRQRVCVRCAVIHRFEPA